MSLSQMQQDHAVYLSALRKEADRVIASVRSKCNANLHNHYLGHIQNAFNEAISTIEKSRKSF